MFKAERSVEGGVVILALSGRITGEEVGELRDLVASEGPESHLVLDLREVKLVDRDVVTFLARCKGGGITLAHCPAYVREWIVRERGAE